MYGYAMGRNDSPLVFSSYLDQCPYQEEYYFQIASPLNMDKLSHLYGKYFIYEKECFYKLGDYSEEKVAIQFITEDNERFALNKFFFERDIHTDRSLKTVCKREEHLLWGFIAFSRLVCNN